MRRSKEIWYLLLFSLLIAAVTGWIMTAGRKEEKNSYTVSVIVNNSSTRLIAYLRENGIAPAFHYVPLHSSPAGEKFGRFHGKDVYTTKESERLLRLPMFYDLSMDDVDYIAEKIREFEF